MDVLGCHADVVMASPVPGILQLHPEVVDPPRNARVSHVVESERVTDPGCLPGWLPDLTPKDLPGHAGEEETVNWVF